MLFKIPKIPGTPGFKKSKKSRRSRRSRPRRSRHSNKNRSQPRLSKRQISKQVKSLKSAEKNFDVLLQNNQHLVNNKELKGSIRNLIHVIKQPPPKDKKEEWKKFIKESYNTILSVVKDGIDMTGSLAKISVPVASAIIVLSMFLDIPGADKAVDNIANTYGKFKHTKYEKFMEFLENISFTTYVAWCELFIDDMEICCLDEIEICWRCCSWCC